MLGVEHLKLTSGHLGRERLLLRGRSLFQRLRFGDRESLWVG